MFTSIHPNTSRNFARAAIPALLVGALFLLVGCVSLPQGKTPGQGAAKVEATRAVAQTSAPSAVPRTPSRSAGETSAPMAPSPKTPGVPTPSATAATVPTPVPSSASCTASDSPDVFAMGAPKIGAAQLPSICITGFEAGAEVELWVTDPEGQSEYYSEIVGEDGTAMVDWSPETDLLEGTYTFEASQGDLWATNSVDVGPGAEAQEPTSEEQEPTPESEEVGSWIDVYPVGDSGWDFEVALGGFEPNQEVLLTLYVATDETMTDFSEVESLSEQVDDQGQATFPLAVTPGDYPSSLFALSYPLKDGSPVYAPFQVEGTP
jgi:hypothetical protein